MHTPVVLHGNKVTTQAMPRQEKSSNCEGLSTHLNDFHILSFLCVSATARGPLAILLFSLLTDYSSTFLQIQAERHTAIKPVAIRFLFNHGSTACPQGQSL